MKTMNTFKLQSEIPASVMNRFRVVAAARQIQINTALEEAMLVWIRLNTPSVMQLLEDTKE